MRSFKLIPQPNTALIGAEIWSKFSHNTAEDFGEISNSYDLSGNISIKDNCLTSTLSLQ